MAAETFISIGLNTGATIYTSLTLEPETSTSTGASTTFDLSLFGGSGEVKNNVGQKGKFGNPSSINSYTWIFDFDYTITSVNILAKNGASGEPTQHDDWATIEGNTVKVKTNITYPLQNDYYVLVLINTPLGTTKYTYTENLQHITSNALSSYDENTTFNITYKADENYLIDTLTSNIGTVDISSDKLTATLSGTATSNINVTGFASLEKVNATYNLTKINTKGLSSYVKNSEVTINFTPYSGYVINTLESSIGGNVAIADDGLSATVTLTASQDFTITGSAVPETVQATYNLTHITTSGEPRYKKNSDVVINFTADTGYIIDTLESTLGTPFINRGKLTGKVTLTASQDFTITGSAVAISDTVNVTYNLTNINTSGASSYTKNSEVTIKFTPYSGYVINTLESSIGGNVAIADDGLSATVTLTASQDFTITGSATPKAGYGYVTITGSFTNCTCNYSNGDQISPNTPITITANDGYIFKEVFTYYSESSHVSRAFETTSDNKQLYTSETESVELNDNYVAVREGKSAGGFTNLYKVTNEELKSLSKVRFYNDVDYGSYILQLYVLPYQLPDGVVGDTTTIILGKYDSNVNSTELLDYTIHINYGDIVVPNKFTNVYDYLDTSCIFRLPFFDSIPIEPQYAVGQTLHIDYTIDLYSGLCAVNITSTFNNNSIVSLSTNIATQIPFIQVTTDNIINQLSTNLLNPITECSLEVIRNVAYDPQDTTFGKPTKIIDTLSNYAGYIEVDNIELSTSATTDELNEIKKLLKSGVFIN